MGEYVKGGDMVEGARCDIYTRKEDWKALHKDPITNKIMVKYELSRNCSVAVSKKLDIPDAEKAIRNPLPLYREVGDKLKALCITVYIDQKKKLGEPVVDKSTGRHEGRLFHTEKRTIGVIKHPFDNIKAVTEKLMTEEMRQIISINSSK